MLVHLVFFCIFCTSVVHGQLETKIVNLDQGPVRGFKDVYRRVFAFQGIPFATEPKGNDKYKAPLPPPKWTEIFNANRRVFCPQQIDGTGSKPEITENCLVANVYAPSTDVKNLPVLVIIHPGGFYEGSGDDLQPQAMVDTQKIVAVSINYRLGVHGFLCLGTESAPGNAGMKDQVAALRWVKENIEKFGGNPNDITIYGCSAGSTSVNLHMLSKMSNGLFQKVIAESASNIAVYATQLDPLVNAKNFAKRLSSSLNVDDLKSLEDFYLKTPVTELTDHVLEIYENYVIEFVPCVERPLDTETFLEASPYSILKSGNFTKVPKMEGITDMEGLLKLISDYDKDMREMNTEFSKFLPGDLQFETETEREEVANSVKEFYFGEREIGPNTSFEYFDFMSDTGFTYSILASIKLQLESGLNTLYLFQYAFVEETTPYIPYTNERGADHGDLYLAVLESPDEQNVSIKYTNMRETLRELWLNFIITGEPVPTSSVTTLPSWPKAVNFNSPYMLLNETLSLETSPLLQEKFDIWDKIYKKHYREPQPPGSKIVNLDQGPVRGFKDVYRRVFAFQGIPFATEPKGNDKYKAPLPPPKWTEIFNANRRVFCPQQIDGTGSKPEITENCLVANVYAPSTDVKNLPVLVIIHPGGFYEGSGDDLQPQAMVDTQKIVAVSINYRLGVHGFLCLGTESAPGNAGMKDQVAALRWVKENIEKFGGNPNDITIYGCSAGSTSVNLHMLSKMSNGLFQKVIAESASNIAVYATQLDPLVNAKNFAKRLSSSLNVDDLKSLEDFYLKTPVTELTDHVLEIYENYVIEFVPCVERPLDTETFLEASPYSILKSGNFTKVPKMEGITDMEGLLKLISDYDKDMREMNTEFSKFLPGDLQFETETEREEVANSVKEFYFGEREIGPNTSFEYFDFMSDTGFTYSILASIKLQLESGLNTLYLFQYAFVEETTPYIPYTNERGADHGDLYLAVLESPDEQNVSIKYTNMRETLRELWLNFIITGEPVPTSSVTTLPSWPKAVNFNSPYMLLNETLSLETSPLLQEKFDLWDKIYKKHYREPQPPGSKIVNLDQGPVRGFKDVYRRVFAFQGIPFATEPKGNDKYKAPLPPPKWTEIFNANRRVFCPQQIDGTGSKPEITENCLVANVYAPSTDVKNLPVLVIIHPGGFYEGSGDDLQPQAMVDTQKIVAVSINYRLGVHGFLCLGTESAPGNAGMKDQVAALRWVKENIEKFGGNPNDITIYGCSAGSTSVNLHMLSKMSNGLFQKVIAESASNIAVYATQLDPLVNAKNFAKRLSSSLNVDDLKSLEDFYLKTPVTELTDHVLEIYENYVIEFVPCVERPLDTETFLEASPYSILKSGNFTKVPKMEGITDMEGLLKLISDYDKDMREMNTEFSKFLPGDLQFETETEREEVANSVKEFYFGEREIGPNTSFEYFDFMSDTGFTYSILASIKLQLESGLNTLYLFQYAFVEETTPYIPYTNERGADHGDLYLAVLESPDEQNVSIKYTNMRETLRELWLNFIITGEPVPTSSVTTLPSWPKAVNFNSPYMLLNETLSLETSPLLQEKFDLWDKIYKKHYREPQPPGSKIVNLDQGPVRGFKDVYRRVFAFQGIPFATEPKGNDKYKAPLPPPKWTEIFNANRRVFCPQQIDGTGSKPEITENCLVANVYAPSTDVKNLPVLVIIHPGGFYEGSGDDLQPQAMVDTQKIVAVSINYRLGVHGFLCLGTESAPGNAGMKDQVAALRWVKENIEKFGGNPNDITIYGCSAGSTSVNLHMLSKMSNGLFQKVIAESASNIAVYATQLDPLVNAKNFAKRLSSSLNVDDLKSLEDFYLKTPVTELTDHVLEIYENYVIEFVPCVERPLDTETFLEASPYSILKSGNFTKVPKMEGITDMEGLLKLISDYDKDMREMNTEFSKFLPGDLQFETETEREEVANSVKEFYFGEREIGPNTSFEYFDFMSDTGFTYSILASIKLQLESGLNTLYLFQYAFVEETTPYIPYTNERGADHGDLYLAVLESPDEQNVSIKYTNMRETLRELWLNFIITGEPVPTSSVTTLPSWPKAVNFNSPYMLLNETLSLETSPLLQEKFDLWDKIYKKHYREPQPPGSKIVNLDQGPVRGFKDVYRRVFAFQGIPFATEPKGNDKYKAPLPPPKWTEIFNANRRVFCPQQIDGTGSKPEITENCLVANVYAPSTDVKNLPVLVIIHPGGFYEGSGDDLQPQAMVDTQKIVAVSINYRLGVHGFLCLGTESAPGNAGMKDQVAALRWVKENIEKFGGNPNDITIYGCSAGSTSVNLHMLSKMSNGLFQKVIAESASNIAVYATQLDPLVNAKNFAKRLSSSLNVDDLKSLEDFYLKTPVTELTDHVLEIYENYVIEFVPCVERPLDTETFLEASPYSILKSGNFTKVPKMEGITDMEGLLKLISDYDKDMREMNTEFSKFLPGDLQFETETEREEVANSVKEFYFGEREIGPNTSFEYFDFMSDTGFTYSILASIKLQLESGLNTLYLFQYAFVEETTPYIPYTNERGADHGDLYLAVLESPDEQNVSIKYTNMRETLRELWLNFIITGEPVPTSSVTTLPSWPKAVNFNSPYMLLNETLSLETSPLLQEKFDLWDKIYKKHYREPQPPGSKIVNLDQGPVRGFKDVYRRVFAFQGIPFATEPKGNDKYKAPLPPPKWTEIFNANRRVFCPQQIDGTGSKPEITENCLVANVYAPSTDVKNLPVLVIIHPGGFYEGSGDDLQPQAMVDTQKIVAVSINYRLGVHGFLCLGTESAPGNAGMKDQVAALRWVKENIEKFGGNPNDITIYGCSAGSTSVNLHMLSKMSNGLFQKVIAESASNIAVYATQLDPLVNAKNFAKRLSSSLNVDDLKSLEDFYLKTPVTELTDHVLEIYENYVIEFVPCVERPLDTETFLEASPYSILKSGNFTKVPKMEGITDMEGLLKLISDYDKDMREMNTEFSKFLPGDLQFETETEREEVANSVKEFYFGEREIGPNTSFEYFDFMSDTGFTYSILASIKLQLESGLNTLYLFQYAFVEETTPYIPYTNKRGADHGELYLALLESPDEQNVSIKYSNMRETLRELWLNFIITGEPVPTSSTLPSWPKAVNFNSPYMLLNETLSLKTSPLLQEKFALWDKIYKKHYREPQPPSSNGYYNKPLLITLVFSIVFSSVSHLAR